MFNFNIKKKNTHRKIGLRRAKRKFVYQKKTYSNPFFKRKRPKVIKISRLSWRLKLIIAEIIILVVGIAWFLFFSSIFFINIIDVEGNQKISSAEIKNLAWQQTNSRLGLQKNIFLFNKERLIEKLNEKYCFDALTVEKKYPSKLKINLKEKTHSAIWYESDNYYYIDAEGNIIEKVDPLEISGKNYPLINNNSENKIIDKKINLSAEKINYIINLFNEFKNNSHGLEIERFIIDNDDSTVKMAILEGPEIYFNTNEDLEKQINKLNIIITEKLKETFGEKTYVDLRYGDRVYYR